MLNPQGNLCKLLTSFVFTIVQPDNSQQEIKSGTWEQKNAGADMA
jgi:hypothetical protein